MPGSRAIFASPDANGFSGSVGYDGRFVRELLSGIGEQRNREPTTPVRPQANFGYYGGYVQTDWKVRPKLTLNLGLRYEVPIPRSTLAYAFTSFDPELINPASGLKGALAYAAIARDAV